MEREFEGQKLEYGRGFENSESLGWSHSLLAYELLTEAE